MKVPKGCCQCGCGGKTNVAPFTNSRRGWVKGQPLGYIHGHNNLKHGFSRRLFTAPEYRSYRNAKQRCQNPKNTYYKAYGARGIEFLFSSFEEFFEELGPRPEPKLLYSLDRIRNNGNYEIGNVRWSTRETQALNQRIRKDNASGHRGICWHKKSSKWMAEIVVHGKHIYLGTFAVLHEAIVARKTAEKQFGVER